MTNFRTIIIGAGAAGLHAAAYTASSGTTLILDHAKKPGEKIRISGGGRCNFTNLHTAPENFISQNPHFAKSALARYSQWDFIDLITRYKIPYHEKTLGQLFTDTTAKDIVALLLTESAPARLRLQTTAQKIVKTNDGFSLELSDNTKVTCENLIIACGGKSIPKMGASGFGYDVARQFGHGIIDTRAGLVPLTFSDKNMALIKPLSGLSLPVAVNCNGIAFHEALLFTHRGLSGPAILQISSYWREKSLIQINLLPELDVFRVLKEKRAENGRRSISTVLGDLLPSRLAASLSDHWGLGGNIADHSDIALLEIANKISGWQVTPIGTEGYRTAEVTVGGVDTDGINARTMESNTTRGLYFIGEVVDVTGWLGGYNFQWAWSSAYAAGTAIAAKYA